MAGQRGLTGGDDGEMNADICASLLGRIKSGLFRNLRGILTTRRGLLALFSRAACFSKHVFSKEADGELKGENIA